MRLREGGRTSKIITGQESVQTGKANATDDSDTERLLEQEHAIVEG